MNKIAIVTDTNSSMTQAEAREKGIFLLPMPVIVDGQEYIEDVTLTYEEFFDRLSKGAEVSTSQPAPAVMTAYWDKLLQDHDEIVHIPMSSALSSSLTTARALAADYGGRVVVVDNKRISVSQRQAALDALTLAERGKSAAEIGTILEEQAYNASIYLAVNTLELLKKSGRVTAAGAAVATVLNLKPVLQIQGEKLDAFAKARGMARAEDIMLKAVRADLDGRFRGKPVHVETAYSGDLASAQAWRERVQKEFPEYEVALRRLPISISCHVGAGVHAAGCIGYIE